MDDVLSNRAMEALLSDMSLHVDLLESDLVDDASMLAADCHIDRVDSDLADEFIVGERRGVVSEVRSRQERPQSLSYHWVSYYGLHGSVRAPFF